MAKLNVTRLEDIIVARVRAEGGPAGPKRAFDELESRMSSLHGRKMYGVFYGSGPEETYYACVKLDDEHEDDMGFERGTIPGGRYARRRVDDWAGNEEQLAKRFEELEKHCVEAGLELDPDRPGIEFYRSMRDMVIMVPVK